MLNKHLFYFYIKNIISLFLIPLFVLVVLRGKLSVILLFLMICHFSTSLNILSLCFTFSLLPMMYLGLNFFVFILLVVYNSFHIYGLKPFDNFVKSSSSIIVHIFLLPHNLNCLLIRHCKTSKNSIK